MKTLSILLVMVGVTLAKPPTRFPDFLAPFRTMFGGSSSSRGSPQPQQQHVEKVPYYASTHSDPTIADTGKQNNPYPQTQSQSTHGQSNNEDGFFPSSFPNYEADGGGFTSYNDVEPQFQSERRPSHFGGGGRSPPHFHHHQSEPPPISSTYGSPEGRPPPKFHHHQSEERHPIPQFNNPSEGRPPPKFHLHHSESRPPPPQFGPHEGQGRPHPKFHLHSEERSPSPQHGSWEAGPPPSPPKFPSEGRPPPLHFHKRPKHQHRPHPHHFPSSNQQRVQDFPAPSFQNHQASHLTHMQDFPTQPQGQSQHQRPSFPEFGSSYNQLQHQRPAGSGFTDFNFNPADFDRGHFMIGGEKRPSESPRHFNPSKSIPFGDNPQQQDRGDVPFGKGAGGPDIITLADVEKGMKGRQNEVYFDDVYKQPPQGHRVNQGDPMSHMAMMRSHKSNSEEVQKSSPTEMGDVHYGKPMTMSGSSNKPTVLKNHGRKYYKKPHLLKSPTIQPPKEALEPLSMAASGHGGQGLENYGEGSGDRILYHVSGHQGPYSYRYGFDTGAGYNRMFRHEEKDGSGLVKGKYGYHDKNGKLQVVNYSAHPTGGFHAERQH